MSYKRRRLELNISVLYGILQLVFIDNGSTAQPSTALTSSAFESTALAINSPRVKKNQTLPQGFDLKSGAATGITFTNRLNTDLSEKSFNLLNGSGVTLGDYDGDGRCDVFWRPCRAKTSCFETLVTGSSRKLLARQGSIVSFPIQVALCLKILTGMAGLT